MGSIRESKRPRWLTGMMILAAAALAQAAGAQGVKVALLPAQQTVAPGSEFDMSIEVTRAGSSFNGFDMYIGYDPAALTLIPLSPISNQEGAYFKAACGSRFHRFMAGSDRDTITDVLLCAGVSLTGPGQIYKLHFRASNTPQLTVIRFLPGLQFYNEGLFVNPDSSSDAVVGIGVPAGVSGPSPVVKRVRLLAAPNPSHGDMTFTVEMDRAGAASLVVCDVQGRAVRHLESGSFAAGVRTVHWDGRNDSGVVVGPGVYLGALHAQGRTLKARFTLVR